MIATIEGVVAEKIGDTVVIELGGIGYEILVTAADWGASAIGQPAKFYIYEQIREDAHNLFGFTSVPAKQLFMQLLSVSGVGPKVAMQVMGATSIDRLQSSIAGGDADIFKGVSGVGKKTAERIMVDLKGKVVATGITGAPVASGDAAYQALIGLGYSTTQAAEAVAAVSAEVIGEQARVKAALKQLS